MNIARHNQKELILNPLIINEKPTYFTKRKYNYLDLFKYPSLRKTTLCHCYIYFASYYCYFSSVVSLPEMGGNVYINGYFLALSEMSSYLFALILLRLCKRRYSLTGSFLSMVLICMPFTFLSIPRSCLKNSHEFCPIKIYHSLAVILLRFFLGINITIG